MKSLVILISGRGTNLRALLEAGLPGRVAAVISNRPDAAGLGIARARSVPTTVVDHQAFGSRVQFDEALADAIDRHAPDLIVLAGFMRVLGNDFVRRYQGRLINIHPSLLPSFPGLYTHRRALEAGVRIHGCTVHFVTPSVDDGPIVIQAAVPVLAHDDEAALAARVLAQEHRIYPQAVRWVLEGHARLLPNRRVEVDAEAAADSFLQVPAIAANER